MSVYLRTKEHRERMSKILTGRKFTEEHKKNMGLTRKGKKSSDETKQKISKAVSGKNHPMWGKKHSEKTKKKISESHGGEKSSWWGKKHTEEEKRKIGLNTKGENHWNWKGGKTPLTKLIRRCPQYRQWRDDVFERDNWTCQFCDIRGGIEINADHIKPFSFILDEYNITTINEAENCAELWNINNGRTLCINCHRQTDTYGSKINDF